jgi:hypothetical protein
MSKAAAVVPHFPVTVVKCHYSLKALGNWCGKCPSCQLANRIRTNRHGQQVCTEGGVAGDADELHLDITNQDGLFDPSHGGEINGDLPALKSARRLHCRKSAVNLVVDQMLEIRE